MKPRIPAICDLLEKLSGALGAADHVLIALAVDGLARISDRLGSEVPTAQAQRPVE